MIEKKKPIWKKWWLYPLVALLLAAVFEMCLFIGVTINASVLDAPKLADVIIVLGAGIDEVGQPKPELERRLVRAQELFDDGYAKAIIVTGAQGDDEPITEAISMKRYLMGLDVVESNVIIEEGSYNTMQNLTNAKAIMDKRGFTTAIVVSTDYHIWRALSMCEDLGIEATGAGARNAETFRQGLINCLRETVSWVKYMLTR